MFWLILASTNCKWQNSIYYDWLFCLFLEQNSWWTQESVSLPCSWWPPTICLLLGIKTKCCRWAFILMAPTPLQFLHRRFDKPPLSSQKSQKRSQKCCDFFQLLFFTSVWQWATVRVKKLFWHGCSLVFIVHPLEIFGPKRLNFYLRMQVALDMGLAWFRNCKFRPYPPIPPAP